MAIPGKLVPLSTRIKFQWMAIVGRWQPMLTGHTV